MVVRINAKRAVLARGTPFAVESERAFEVVGSALRARFDRFPGVDSKFRAAAQTQMIRIIPDSPIVRDVMPLYQEVAQDDIQDDLLRTYLGVFLLEKASVAGSADEIAKWTAYASVLKELQ